MKTIEEAINNFIFENESDIRLDLGAAGFDYVKQAFKTGVELAKKFIPIEEELPKEDIWAFSKKVIIQFIYDDKICFATGQYDYAMKKWYSGDNEIDNVIAWRYINIE